MVIKAFRESNKEWMTADEIANTQTSEIFSPMKVAFTLRNMNGVECIKRRDKRNLYKYTGKVELDDDARKVLNLLKVSKKDISSLEISKILPLSKLKIGDIITVLMLDYPIKRRDVHNYWVYTYENY